MAKYDVYRAFENIPTIMGMDLVRRGDRWEGGYYMNGERHSHRRDKIKVAKWNNDIWVHEEGGESQSITTWLMNYGGASDFREAIRILKGSAAPVRFEDVFRNKTEVKTGLFVPKDAYNGEAAYDLNKCNLFRWMVWLFAEDKVREAWERYSVTTDAHGNAVFWSIDIDGHILHDKRMAYKDDGHRNRDFGAWRKYTIGKGYDGKAFFGAYAWKDEDEVYVVESEKTALLGYLYWGKPFIATGGKNALREIDQRLILVPDMDARQDWEEKGRVSPWWEVFDNVGEHDDVGDAIVREILESKK